MRSELQKEIDTLKLSNPSYENIQSLVDILNHELKQQSEPDPELLKARNDWLFKLCQHYNSNSAQYVDTLSILFNSPDPRWHFKVNVALELGLSLLTINYPVAPLQVTAELKSIAAHLNKASMNTSFQAEYMRMLAKQLEKLSLNEIPAYPRLTIIYNELLLENINSYSAKHKCDLVSAAHAVYPTFFSFCLPASHLKIDLEKPNPLTLHSELLRLVHHKTGSTDTEHLNSEPLPQFREQNLQQATLVFLSEDSLSPTKVQAILVPTPYYDQTRAVFQNITIIPINLTETKNSHAQVPDYLAGLQLCRNQLSAKQFIAYIAPLTTVHDMENHLLPNSPWGAQLSLNKKKEILKRLLQSRSLLRTGSMNSFLSPNTPPATQLREIPKQTQTLSEKTRRLT